MSDWEEFCENMGADPGSSEDYERMLDLLPGVPSLKQSHLTNDYVGDESTALRFGTFQEAAAWAKNGKGRAFTRSADGKFFVPLGNILSKQANSLIGLEDHEVAAAFAAIMVKLSPHFHWLYTTVRSNFSQFSFIQDLNKLNKSQVIELKNVLEEYLELEKETLTFMQLERKKYRKKRLKDSEFKFMHDLEQGIAMCHLRLR